jgi:hypothetical protein
MWKDGLQHVVRPSMRQVRTYCSILCMHRKTLTLGPDDVSTDSTWTTWSRDRFADGLLILQRHIGVPIVARLLTDQWPQYSVFISLRHSCPITRFLCYEFYRTQACRKRDPARLYDRHDVHLIIDKARAFVGTSSIGVGVKGKRDLSQEHDR